MRRVTLTLLALALLVLPVGSAAQAPIQVSLVPPIQIVPESEAVKGLRLGIFARNSAMTGFDLAVATHTTGDMQGLQVTLVNVVDGDLTGVQLGWGLGGSLVNLTRGRMQGFQAGIYNEVGGGEGMQWGLVNRSNTRMSGFQLSLVNIAEDFYGLQVGLINIIRSKDSFPILPLVNWKFD